MVYEDALGLLDLPLPRLPGRHQIDNAALAIACLRQVAPQIDARAMEQGLSRAEWPARLQRLTRGALLAHAGGGFIYLALHTLLAAAPVREKAAQISYGTLGFASVALLLWGMHDRDWIRAISFLVPFFSLTAAGAVSAPTMLVIRSPWRSFSQPRHRSTTLRRR